MEKSILLVLKLIEDILGHSIINDPVWSKNIELFLNEEIKKAGLKDSTGYMNLLLNNDVKLNQFIHKVLIHKTRWFREDLYLQYLQNVFDSLKKQYPTMLDERGNIGKRYYTHDEIGTPFCITVDYQTLEDDTVTIRSRDTATQERIGVNELKTFLDTHLSPDTI
jgi:histidyl-tRNA synthetase